MPNYFTQTTSCMLLTLGSIFCSTADLIFFDAFLACPTSQLLMGATLISKINSKKSKILLVTFILPRTIILECKVLDKIVIVFKWMPIHKNQTYCIDAHLINQGLLKCFSCSWINVLFLDTKHSTWVVDTLVLLLLQGISSQSVKSNLVLLRIQVLVFANILDSTCS